MWTQAKGERRRGRASLLGGLRGGSSLGRALPGDVSRLAAVVLVETEG